MKMDYIYKICSCVCRYNWHTDAVVLSVRATICFNIVSSRNRNLETKLALYFTHDPRIAGYSVAFSNLAI
jgi:hypothetical protein